MGIQVFEEGDHILKHNLNLKQETIMMDLLIAAAVTLAVAFVLAIATLAYAKHAYNKIPKKLDVDDYVGRNPSAWECLQCLGLRNYASFSRHIHSEPYEIVAEEQDIQGLKVTRRANENEKPTEMLTQKKTRPPIIVGTIRKLFRRFEVFFLLVFMH